jgi:hypothetical protein
MMARVDLFEPENQRLFRIHQWGRGTETFLRSAVFPTEGL